MFDRWTMVIFKGGAHRVVSVLAAVLAFAFVLTMGVAQACPPKAVAAASQSDAVQLITAAVETDAGIKATAEVVVTAAAAGLPAQVDGCCGAAHASGAGCASGTCAPCASMVPNAVAGIWPDDGTGDHIPWAAAGMRPAPADANFRPPRAAV